MKLHLFWALALLAAAGTAAFVGYQQGSGHQADALGSLSTANRTAVDEIDQLSKTRDALKAEAARQKEEDGKQIDALAAKVAALEKELSDGRAAAQKTKDALLEAQGSLREAEESLAKQRSAPAPAVAAAPVPAAPPPAEAPKVAPADMEAFQAAWLDLLPQLNAKEKTLRDNEQADRARRGSQHLDLHDEGEFSPEYAQNVALAGALVKMKAAVGLYATKYPALAPSQFANAKLAIAKYEALDTPSSHNVGTLRNTLEAAARVAEGGQPPVANVAPGIPSPPAGREALRD